MGFDTGLTRKQLLTSAVLGAASLALANSGQDQDAQSKVKAAAENALLPLTDEQAKAIQGSVTELHKSIGSLRKTDLPNNLGPAFVFRPSGRMPESKRSRILVPSVVKPDKVATEDLLNLTILEVQAQLKAGHTTSRELTELSLARLRKYGSKLLCYVTLLEERALKMADESDNRRKQGRSLGHLDGLPCGIKDLFALRGYPTTWGAEPFQDQVLDYDSTVTKRLDAAGAVIVAKLTLGALAMDDKWFGGQTRNPWKPSQGSSGSSAGSASAMAARLVSFTVGTETLGSIVSPSQRCRVTGLRPTFGRISRYGAMALSWTMDKVGPICGCAQDCALVLAALHGADGRDPMSVDQPLYFDSRLDRSKLKVGYLSSKPLDEDDPGGELASVLELFRSLGVSPKPVSFRQIPPGTDELLAAEAAAAFQQITLDGRVDTMSRSLWPAIFRTAHFMSGVDYVQAMRARTLVMRNFEEDFGDFDLVIAPDRGGFTLYNTNLTGHPQIYVPNGTDSRGNGTGFSLIGRLFDEGTIAALAQAVQEKTGYHRQHPDMAAIADFDPT
ncbi:MAG: amidase [Fimbriimonadaceae bacterium]|nr:amidase [Fimbriimonadaceae bacterium]